MLTETIPSYLYVQYQDEPETGVGSVSDLQAFVNAYNSIAQGYLNSVNDLRLPIYTAQTGAMLDWVAFGIYGTQRPALSSGNTFSPLGVYNTVPYNTTAYSEDVKEGEIIVYNVTDDYFKRILTWNFYKGDGFQFTTQWLKRRIKRFLFGVDGINFPIEETYDVSVEYSSPNTINITIPDVEASPIFEAALAENIINVPFQYVFTVSY